MKQTHIKAAASAPNSFLFDLMVPYWCGWCQSLQMYAGHCTWRICLTHDCIFIWIWVIPSVNSTYTQKLLTSESAEFIRLFRSPKPEGVLKEVWEYLETIFCRKVWGPVRKERMCLLFLPRLWPLWGPCNTSASPQVFEDGSLLSVNEQGETLFLICQNRRVVEIRGLTSLCSFTCFGRVV